HRLGAEEGHARRVGVARARLVVMGTHVRAHPIHGLGHAGGAIVRFAPVSASKTASLVVSKASSIDCPAAAFDSAETLAPNWFSCTSPSASSSSSWAECTAGPEVVKYTYLSAPSDSTRSTF